MINVDAFKHVGGGDNLRLAGLTSSGRCFCLVNSNTLWTHAVALTKYVFLLWLLSNAKYHRFIPGIFFNLKYHAFDLEKTGKKMSGILTINVGIPV